MAGDKDEEEENPPSGRGKEKKLFLSQVRGEISLSKPPRCGKEDFAVGGAVGYPLDAEMDGSGVGGVECGMAGEAEAFSPPANCELVA